MLTKPEFLKKYLWIAYILSILYNSGTQKVSAQLSDDMIINSNSIKVKESLMMSTDRELYISGETILMKIYKLDGISQRPSNLSKVVYIELINSYGHPVARTKVSIMSPSGPANIIIPDSVSTGQYLIRGYTQWMRNDGPDTYTLKNINIINPYKNTDEIDIKKQTPIVDTVLFFPEGGKMLEGTVNKLGIWVLGTNGHGVETSGFIIGPGGDTLNLLNTDRNGMAILNMEYSDSSSLYLMNDQHRSYSLPRASVGLVLRVEETPEKETFILSIANGGKDANKEIQLLVTTNGLVTHARKIILGSDSIIYLPKSNIPKGISQLSLVSEEGDEISSRWIYNKTEEPANIKIKLDKPSYGKREIVNGALIIANKNGQPLDLDLSIAVVKKISSEARPGNINTIYNSRTGLYHRATDSGNFQDLLLFFNRNDPLLDHKLDTNQVHMEYLPELEGHLISGQVISKSTNQPLANVNMILSVVGKTARCQFDKTDDLGRFQFVSNLKGIKEVVIQPFDPQEVYIEISSSYDNRFSKARPRFYHIDTSQLDEINRMIISCQINQMYAPVQAFKPEESSHSDMFEFFGQPVYNILIDDYISMNSTPEVIKELVPMVSLNRNKGIYKFKLLHKFQGRSFTRNPFVLVDGTPFDDINQIVEMDPVNLERIEVLNMRYFVKNLYLDGIIHFVTRQGNLETFDFDHTKFRQAYELCQNFSSFYSPIYNDSISYQSRLPDYRNTLYWDPTLSIGDKGKSKFSFYTSDETGEYLIIVEGISPTGETAYKTIKFEVQ